MAKRELVATPRLATGVEGLDALLGGGLPDRRLTLLYGGTGVGKTVVGCALVEALAARGVDVGVMKPVETGVGEPGPLDALALIYRLRQSQGE